MKKGLFAILLFAVALVTFGLSARAAGTGNLVVHFQSWTENYENLGSWAWGDTAAGRLADGMDEFGAYFEFNNVAVGTEVGFIAVTWIGTEGPDWNKKLTDDIFIPSDTIIENETVHVYVFEGKLGNGNAGVYVADPTKHNALVVYFDPSASYSETLGIHGWGWDYENDPEIGASQWGTPTRIFSVAGRNEAGIDVWAAMLSANEDWAGFLVYGGDDATKKTGDINDSNFITNLEDGAVNFAYIVNAGDAVTSNENVFSTPDLFREAAFSFKLMGYNPEEMSGTYAIDKNTVVVETSASVASPYFAAETPAEQEAALEAIKAWFTITDGSGNEVQIERVDFGRSFETLKTFVVILSGDGLDNTKDYTVEFDTNYPEALAEAKMIEVTINVTVPANTPADAVISLGASFGGWNPGDANWAATKTGTNEYSITFDLSVTEAVTTFEYKWTQGSWDIGENLAEGNRKFELSNDMTEVVFEDVILAWDKDADAANTKYAATNRTVFLPTKASASLELELDREDPLLTFISPLTFVGAAESARVIEVPWGEKFDQTLFPRFAVTDDRDGDLTSFVYVPKGEFSVIDTREEGDYTIMLRVVDTWGNVTEETFIFRVVKGE